MKIKTPKIPTHIYYGGFQVPIGFLCDEVLDQIAVQFGKDLKLQASKQRVLGYVDMEPGVVPLDKEKLDET